MSETPKIEQDWAYKQAKQIVTMFDEPALCPLSIKRIASMLRRAYRKGGEAQRINDNTKALQASMPKITVEQRVPTMPSVHLCRHGVYAAQCYACAGNANCANNEAE
jgi:hypothetical protein